MKFESCSDAEKLVGIMMDKMKVKSGLVFSKRTDRIVGLSNLAQLSCFTGVIGY